MRRDRGLKTLKKILSLFPSALFTSLFLILLILGCDERSMIIEMIVAGIIGIFLGVLSAILIIIWKIDMTKYIAFYFIMCVMSVVVVIFSWWVFFEFPRARDGFFSANLPLVTFFVSVAVFFGKNRKIKDSIILALINPNLYYVIFANSFRIGF